MFIYLTILNHGIKAGRWQQRSSNEASGLQPSVRVEEAKEADSSATV